MKFSQAIPKSTHSLVLCIIYTRSYNWIFWSPILKRLHATKLPLKKEKNTMLDVIWNSLQRLASNQIAKQQSYNVLSVITFWYSTWTHSSPIVYHIFPLVVGWSIFIFWRLRRQVFNFWNTHRQKGRITQESKFIFHCLATDIPYLCIFDTYPLTTWSRFLFCFYRETNSSLYTFFPSSAQLSVYAKNHMKLHWNCEISIQELSRSNLCLLLLDRTWCLSTVCPRKRGKNGFNCRNFLS